MMCMSHLSGKRSYKGLLFLRRTIKVSLATMLHRNFLQANCLPPPPNAINIPIQNKTPSEIASIIETLSVEDFIVAPGHEYLEISDVKLPKPTEVHQDNEKNPAPIIVNGILSDNRDILEYVDIWDGHHRLKHFSEVYPGISLINDMIFKTQTVMILVDGQVVRPSNSPHRNDTIGERCAHWLPLWGIFLGDNDLLDRLANNWINHEFAKEYTVAVPPGNNHGPLSNVHLGSRTTLKAMNNPKLRFRSIEFLPEYKCETLFVYFGTFDPIHRGHEEIVHHILRSYSKAFILLVPYANPVINSSNFCGSNGSSKDKDIVMSLHHRENMLEMYVNTWNNQQPEPLQGRIKVLKGMTPYRGDEAQRKILLHSLSQYFCLPISSMVQITSPTDNPPNPMLIAQGLQFLSLIRTVSTTTFTNSPQHSHPMPISLSPSSSIHSGSSTDMNPIITSETTTTISSQSTVYEDPWHVSTQQIRMWLQSYYAHEYLRPELHTVLKVFIHNDALDYILDHGLYQSSTSFSSLHSINDKESSW